MLIDGRCWHSPIWADLRVRLVKAMTQHRHYGHQADEPPAVTDPLPNRDGAETDGEAELLRWHEVLIHRARTAGG